MIDGIEEVGRLQMCIAVGLEGVDTAYHCSESGGSTVEIVAVCP